MARTIWGAVIYLAAASLSASNCFSSEVLTGSPCREDGFCGDDLTCLDGFCKPSACTGNSACRPYTVACAASDGGRSCPAVGTRGCFVADSEPDAGYCALACEESSQCPAGANGTATPQCVAADAEGDATVYFCALDCGDARDCPTNMHCVEVEIEATSRALCMSGAKS